MSTLHPFPALRPPRELAARVSSLPYDVMNHREAKEMAAGNDASFLHICRSDIDTSEAAIHAPETYAKARENLERFVREGYLFRDERPSFYIYRQIMWGRVQTGIVGCASVDEYASGAIKKHELTRREKELDRIEHFDACSAQTEPVFLAYRKHEGLSAIIREWIKFHKPEYDFTTEDGVTHILWPVSEPGTVEDIRKSFEEVDALYIADGHHRTASSAAVSARRRQKHPDYTGQEEFNYLMAVVFCDEDLFIMDYNRVIRDLNGLTEEEFIEKLQLAGFKQGGLFAALHKICVIAGSPVGMHDDVEHAQVRVLRAHIPDVFFCQKRAHSASPPLWKKYQLRFVISYTRKFFCWQDVLPKNRRGKAPYG